MSVRLLVKNIVNSYACGDVIAVCDGSHVFGRYESKAVFIESGLTDWPRQFVIINIEDANTEDFNFLLEDNEDSRRYFLTPQLQDSPFYSALLANAEITTTKSVIMSLVNDRGA